MNSLTTNAGGTTAINGGTVTTAGDQIYGDNVTLGANALLDAGSGNVNLSGTVNGPFGLTVNSTGTTTFGGLVGGGTPLTSVTTNDGGTVALNGGGIATTNGNQTFNENVTLGANTVLSAGTGNVTFTDNVNGNFALTVNSSGATSFGDVGVGTPLASLTTDENGTTTLNGTAPGLAVVRANGNIALNDDVIMPAATGTDLISLAGDITLGKTVTGTTTSLSLLSPGVTTLGGAVTVESVITDVGGSTAINGGAVTTTAAQTYGDAVTLNAAGPGNSTTLTGTDISFGSTINSTTSGEDGLIVRGTGTTTFSGAIGNSGPLASLSSNNGGTTVFNGSSGVVNTTGAQTYSDAVTLGVAAATFTSSSNGAVSFGSNLDGAASTTVNTGGATTFTGAVGGTTPLTSLTTNAGGSTAINGGNVATTGSQSYGDNVTLNAAGNTTTLSGQNISFGGTLGGATNLEESLTITAGGTTTFGGAVGGAGTRLNNLSVASTGAVTQGAGALSAANLRLTGAGQITLANAGNDVDVLAVATTSALPFSFSDTDDLAIGTLNGTAGLTAAGNVTLTTGGLLTIGSGAGEDISAAGQIVDINAAGVTEAAGNSIINASQLRLQGTGTFALTGLNTVGTLAANVVTGAGTPTTFPFTYTDSDAITIGTVLGTVGITSGTTTNGGNILINAGGVITVTDLVTTAAGIPANLGTIIAGPTTILTTPPRADTGDTIRFNRLPAGVNDPQVAGTYTIVEDSGLFNSTTTAQPSVLSNDSDPDGVATLVVSAFTQPPASVGTVNVNPDGTFTFTPALNFSGTASFTYQASDGVALSNFVTVTIVVQGVNDAPTIVNDGGAAFTTPEDVTLTTANVQTNDFDPDGPNFQTFLVTPPARHQGTFVLNPNGSFVYIPEPNFFGTDSFVYRGNDGLVDSIPQFATVTITVSPVNDTPVAVNDPGYSTNEDVTLNGTSVLGNDTDPDNVLPTPPNTGLTAELVQGPANGSFVLNSNGTFTYTPLSNFNGTDSFTYRARDAGGLLSNIATVGITINAVSDAPVAVNDGPFATNEDVPLSVPATGVLLNDTDLEGDAIETLIVGAPANAVTFTLNANGSFTYVPNPNFFGTDSFTYRARETLNPLVQSNIATVTITVNAVNDAPVAAANSYSTDEDVQLTVNTVATGVLGNDTDVDTPAASLSAVLEPGGNVTRGTLALAANGTFTYTPFSNTNGVDSFVYRVSDGSLTSNLATVQITVNALNDAPVAVDDSFTYTEDTPRNVPVTGLLANDTDVDAGDTRTVITTPVVGPANGSVVLNANGSFVYTPNLNFNGRDSFSYRIQDAAGATSNIALVILDGIAVNDDPVAVADSYTLFEDATFNLPAPGVKSNDSDVDVGDTLTVQQQGGTTNGTLTLNGNGSFSYTPNANFAGQDSFTYRLSDGSGVSNTVTVTLTVQNVDDPPVTTNDAYATDEDAPLSVPAPGVLANDTDPDLPAPTLAASPASPPSNGSLLLNLDGSFTYTPNANFNGTDSFTYRASDGVNTTLATVVLTVNAVNDPPVAVGNALSTQEDVNLVVPSPNNPNILANDTDIDSPPASLTAVLETAMPTTQGTLTPIATGGFTFDPAPDFFGVTSFTYRARDGQLNSLNVATVTINVTAVNDNPIGVNDTYTIVQNTPRTVTNAAGVTANDIDVDGDLLIVTKLSDPAHGSLTLNALGGFTYTPGTDRTDDVSFTYTATDGAGTTNVVTVTLDLVAVNQPPTAVNDGFTVAEDGVLTVNTPGPLGQGVLANDTDFENGALSAVPENVATANGTLVLNANGSFSYTPNPNFSGTDSFTYRANDGTVNSTNVGTVTITVTAVNDAPVAVNDTFNATEGLPLNQAAPGVLANDNDIDTGTRSAELVGNVPSSAGFVSLNGNGSFIYTPAANFSGTTTFTYRANDGQGVNNLSNVATVTLVVGDVNSAPVAVNDAFATDEDTLLNATGLGVLANDTDADVPAQPLSVALFPVVTGGPAHGTLTLNSVGSFIYTPGLNRTDAVSFTYRVSDGSLFSNTATVAITIRALNDLPLAVNDTFAATEDLPLTVAGLPGTGVLANDIDPESPPQTLTASIDTLPTNGSLVLNANGGFTYTPSSNFFGADSFTYRASDGIGTGNLATVTINVAGANDAPSAAGDTFDAVEDQVLTITPLGVLANDVDVDGNPLTAVLDVDVPASAGTLALNANGGFVFTPAANFNGATSFSYHARDNAATPLNSIVVVVRINVAAVNDAPVAVNDTTFSTPEDVALTISGPGLVGNDTDVDNINLFVATGTVTQPPNGTVAVNPNGGFTYTPNANFFGTDSFTYFVTDGTLNSASRATVTIAVTPTNDQPVAVNDSRTVQEDGVLNSPTILVNDTDVETPILTASLVTGPANGTISLDATGTFRYTPLSNYFTRVGQPPDSFTYRASDGGQFSNLATVTITVTGVNDDPVALPDSYTVQGGVATTIAASGVLANDADVDGDPLTAALEVSPLPAHGPSRGTVIVNSNGSFTYTPNVGVNSGFDSFTYRANDGTTSSGLATVTIRIVPGAPNAPTATNDAYATNEDTQLIVANNGVLGNDNDIDGDTLTAVLVGGVANGTLTLNPGGGFTYSPNANFFGTDTFTYRASDGALQSTVATVALTINSVNDAPRAVNDSYQTDQNTPLTRVAANGVLINDTDVELSPLTAVRGPGSAGPAHGSVTFNSNGSFTYTPALNYTGFDSFTYQANDGSLSGNFGTVTINVTAVNQAPQANNDTFPGLEDTPLTVDPTANDFDVEGADLSSVLVTGPASGTLTLNGDGATFTYRPNANFNGTDSFTYRASDGALESNLATVVLTISAVNDAPVVVNDAFSTLQGQPRTVAAPGLLINDTDVENNPLSVITTPVAGPANGTLTLSANGSFTYTPNGTFIGSDSFTYRISDGQTQSLNVGTVTLSVGNVNDAPVANNDARSTPEDQPVTIAVLANDTDPDAGDVLTPVLATGPTRGTLVLNANNSFTYTPNANFSGSDSFTYRARDNGVPSLDSNLATVTITVLPLNDVPVAAGDSASVAEDGQLVVPAPGLLGNDVDADGDTLTPVVVVGPAHGTLTLTGTTGGYTYTPAANYFGPDSFSYRATDASSSSDTVLVTIDVAPVNDAPSAVNDTFNAVEDNQQSIGAPGVLGNDLDLDGDDLTATVVTAMPASVGTVNLSPDGSFIFTPAANFDGQASFTYRVSDGTINSANVGTVTILVAGVNDAPVANNNTFGGTEDNLLTQAAPGVLTGDTDVDLDGLTAQLVQGPASGTLTLLPTGGFTYSPNGNFFGTDSFSYRAFDGAAFSNTAVITLNITGTPEAPVAGNDTYSMAQGGTLTIAPRGVLINDSDVDGDTLTAQIGATLAGLTLNANGGFTYTPAANITGQVSFTYRANDGGLNSNFATVTINVGANNTAPVATADTYNVAEDGVLVINNPGPRGLGVLSNDTDTNLDSLTADLVAGPTRGTLTLNGDGSFRYTPNANYFGPDSFTYRAFDGQAFSSAVAAVITVTPVDDSPVSLNDNYSTPEDTQLVISAVTAGVLSNDSDAEGANLTVALVGQASRGTAVLNANGTFTYTPTLNLNGLDSFTYRASDGPNQGNLATVFVNVQAVNDAPTAQNDTRPASNEDVQIIVNAAAGVLSNDNDIDSANLTAQLVTGPANGQIQLASDGSYTYTPNANFFGTDSFTYRASDGFLTSNLATVTLTVTSQNDLPVAVADFYNITATVPPTPQTVTAPGVIGNDFDVDNDPLLATIGQLAGNGTVALNANGSFTYTPNAGFSGLDSFSYRVSDSTGNSNFAVVTLNVSAQPNTAPVAFPNSYTTPEDNQLSIPANGVLGNDTDVNNDPLTAIIDVQPANGTVTLNANGSFIYRPNLNFNGQDSFSYHANDGRAQNANSNVVVVTINVTPVNDAPVATGHSFTFDEDTTFSLNGQGVLAGDTDADLDALIAVAVGAPTNGSLTLNANGTFSYTPRANFNGVDSFTYRATDGTLESNLATVTLNVTAVRDVPVAVNDSFTVTRDTTLTIGPAGVLSNDTDGDGNNLTAAIVDPPVSGTLNLNANGGFSYTPAAGFTGTATFTYRANDGAGNSNTATVAINVTALPNRPPVAGNDSYQAIEDTTLTIDPIGVLANDNDPDNDGLTAQIVSGPAQGSLTLNPNGSFTYTPLPNYFGPDAFTYQARDGQLSGNIAVVSIDVAPINDAPVAAGNSYNATENQTLTVGAATGVLTGDFDQEGNPLSALLVTGPANGSLTLQANGSFTYTPNANFSGADSFSYRASDGLATSGVAVVTLSVQGVPNAPVAANDSYTTAFNTALSVSSPGVLSNDFDADPGTTLSAVLVTGVNPASGTLVLNPNGGFVFTPAAGFSGGANFTYRASDGNLTSSPVTVSITVLPQGGGGNVAPVAGADSYTAVEDVLLNVTVPGVLANDTDANNDILSASVVVGPAHGTLNLNGNGSFSYRPDLNYSGSDSFTYRATDGLLNSLATVSLTVVAVNDAPVAVVNSYNATEDVPLNILPPAGVLANDSDVDSANLTAVLVSGPQNGVLTLAGDGSFLYVPDAHFNGTDTFLYRVSDGVNLSNVVAVTLNVASVPDAPISGADNYTVTQNGTLTVPALGVLANDSDADGNVLTATRLSSPANGTLVFNANGSFTYTPNAGFAGTDSFTYQASDGVLGSAVTTVTLSVSPVANAAPTATNDNYQVAEDGVLFISNVGPLGRGVLSNDTDPNAGTILSAVIVDGPDHGQLSLNANGSFSYTPEPNYTGPDNFSYRASDGLLLSNVGLVTLTVQPVNDAPSAGDDSYDATEDTTLNVAARGVLNNDSDVEGSTLTPTVITPPAHGTVVVNGDGSFSYTPSANYSGQDSFTYQVNDGSLVSNVATVRFNIAPVNDAPVAVNDRFSTQGALSPAVPAPLQLQLPGVLTNDTDADVGDTLGASLVNGPNNGTLTLNTNGSFTYTPAANFFGSDTFTYRVSDGQLSSNVATVAINVVPVANTAPIVVGDTFEVIEDTELVVGALGVLGNDQDAENDTLTAFLASPPANGSLTLNANGGFRYTPAPDFTGGVSFTYRASDGQLTSSNLATVFLNVQPRNDRPIAVGDSFETDEDQPLIVGAGTLQGNDRDPDSTTQTLSVVIGASPQHGTLNLAADGSFTYTPDSNYFGPDIFSYRASDGTLQSDLAVVSITVTAVNDAPVANDDPAASIPQALIGVPMFVPAPGVLRNDADIDSPTLTAVLETAPTTGTLTLNPDGSFTYTAGPGASPRTDSFSYRANDGQTNSSTVAIVLIPVVSGNTAPSAVNDTRSMNEDQTVNFPSVLGNDTDPENNTLTAVLVSGPAGGNLTLNLDGSFSYTPAANANGAVSFVYKANDGLLDSTTNATVTINIAAVNDAPSFVKGTDRSANDTSGPQSVTGWATSQPGPATATDEVGQTVAFDVSVPTAGQALFAPGPGQPAISATGVLTFTPAFNARGQVTITVNARDTGGTANGGVNVSAPQTFVITINKPNPWFNAIPGTLAKPMRLDVNLDGDIAPNDAVLIINYLNARLPDAIPSNAPVGGATGNRFLDPSADNFVAPNDAAQVINWLNQNPVGGGGGGEGEGAGMAAMEAFAEIAAASAPVDDFFFDMGVGLEAATSVNTAASGATDADLASIIAALADDAAQQNKKRRTQF